MIQELLEAVEKKLKGKHARASLADYIRLMQMQKELAEESVREIRVGWVDRLESDDGRSSS